MKRLLLPLWLVGAVLYSTPLLINSIWSGDDDDPKLIAENVTSTPPAVAKVEPVETAPTQPDQFEPIDPAAAETPHAIKVEQTPSAAPAWPIPSPVPQPRAGHCRHGLVHCPDHWLRPALCLRHRSARPQRPRLDQRHNKPDGRMPQRRHTSSGPSQLTSTGLQEPAAGTCYSGEARLLSCSISLAGPSRCSVGLATVCSMGLCRAAIKVGALLNSKRLVMNIANDMRLRL
jgi:hypothetical protein